MNFDDYAFVFKDWHPKGVKVVQTGWSRCIHLGLNFIEFHAVTDEFAVSVRCDPCSAWQAAKPYREMVRYDLEFAVAKQRRDSNKKEKPMHARLKAICGLRYDEIAEHQPPLLTPISPIAIEIENLFRKAERLENEIAGIRSTLLVNFGETKHNKYGFVIKDEGSTGDLVMQALTKLTGA